MRFAFALFLTLATAGAADPGRDRLVAATEATFPRVPDTQVLSDITGVCGGGVTADAVYCTSENRIYLSPLSGSRGIYVLAHLYGHGVQVRYGVADLALNAIRAAPEREADLRGMVTRQVECLAGVLVARAGLPVPRLDELFRAEPMTDAHWGRRPVRAGPEVSIGLGARAEWFARGAEVGSAVACTVGEMSAGLIAEAEGAAPKF